MHESSSEKFPAHCKLDSKGFSSVFNAAKAFKCFEFTLLSRENGLGFPRLGLIVAKKQIKYAVKRNYIKRRLRENFRLKKKDLPCVDLVVIVRKSVLEHNKPAERLDELWEKLINYYQS